MEISPKHQENHNPQSLLPSPNGHSNSSGSSSGNGNGNGNGNSPTTPTANNGFPTTQLPISRSESAIPYPTTFVQADTSNFKQVVQMLTGSPRHTNTAAAAVSQPDPSPKSHAHNIPPIKSIPKKNQSSGFKLYERRNSLKNLKINPLNPIFAPSSSGFSPRKPEILSPSILDFPKLVLSPVTPLIPDPFDRSGAANYSNCYSPISNPNRNHNNDSTNGNLVDADAAQKAINDKGFYMHPSPATTPREAERPTPRLLPLFPLTPSTVSGSSNPSS